jgi:hypothetical protein
VQTNEIPPPVENKNPYSAKTNKVPGLPGEKEN